MKTGRRTYRYLILASVILIANVFSSCKDSISPGPITKEVRNLNEFTGISIGHGFVAEISYNSDEQDVIVEVPENFQQYIITNVVDGVMTLKVDNSVNLKDFNTRKIYISTASLNYIGASGGSNCFSADDFSNNEFTFNLSGGSQSDMSIECLNMRISLSGGSSLSLEGMCNTITSLNASGGSQHYGFNFIAQNINIEASGGSMVEVNVTKALTVTASGGSNVYYKGLPDISKNLSGGSNLIDKN